MRRIRVLTALVLVGLCAGQGRSWGQGGFGFGEIVFDPSNFVENALTAVRALEIINNQLTDLEPRAEGPGGELAGLLDEMFRLLASMQGLIPFQGAAVIGIFGVLYPAVPPCTSGDIRRWQLEAERQTRLALLDSMRAQALIGTSDGRVGQLLRLVEQITGLLGSVRGLQHASEVKTMLVGEMMSLNTINATFHRSVASREAMQVTERAAFNCQWEKTMLDWPRR